MKAEAYFIPEVGVGRLAIMPRPRAGDWLEDEVESWRDAGIDVVVSLLEDGEVAELGLRQEQELCERAGLTFLRLPIPDRGLPGSRRDVSRLVESLVEHLRAGRGVGIHCRVGVGRSALIAACVLTALGTPLEAAWSAIARARGLPVPDTPEQMAWPAGA
jgi:protein-tyrosine phosphatase